MRNQRNFVLKGNATEVGNHIFNFYIMDSNNYWNWLGGKAYVAYFEKKNVTSTSFSIPLTKDQATSLIYFVAENSLVGINETVKVSATLEWQEKATIAATIGGWILGGIITILGFIVIMIVGVLALILKPKTP